MAFKVVRTIATAPRKLLNDERPLSRAKPTADFPGTKVTGEVIFLIKFLLIIRPYIKTSTWYKNVYEHTNC
jgi:hypothetical protein